MCILTNYCRFFYHSIVMIININEFLLILIHCFLLNFSVFSNILFLLLFIIEILILFFKQKNIFITSLNSYFNLWVFFSFSFSSANCFFKNTLYTYLLSYSIFFLYCLLIAIHRSIKINQKKKINEWINPKLIVFLPGILLSLFQNL